MTKAVTRFAPSPTGNLHVGTSRTALFNWLWARHTGGQFQLRIEDTDRKRLIEGAEDQIKESLVWLGMEWDGDIVHQSSRVKEGVYRRHAEELLANGHAYESKEPDGAVIRFKWPEGVKPMEVVYFEAGKRREKRMFDKSASPSAFEDFVLIKSDGYPTYNFAHVIDDHDMGITDVIRGDEFIPSLNKYVALYQAFGWRRPRYVHVPTIHGPDRTKLSKRHGARDVLGYREEGYLPGALVNYLSLIGWSPKNERELYLEVADLIDDFDLAGLQESPGVFDQDKLRWMNGEHLKNLDAGAVLVLAQQSGFWPHEPREHDGRVVEIELERTKTLRELGEIAESYYYHRPKLKASDFGDDEPGPVYAGWLERVLRDMTKLPEDNWTIDRIQNLLTDIQEELRLIPKQLLPLLRIALTGAPKTPSVWELAWALGKTETIVRLEAAQSLVE